MAAPYYNPNILAYTCLIFRCVTILGPNCRVIYNALIMTVTYMYLSYNIYYCLTYGFAQSDFLEI